MKDIRKYTNDLLGDRISVKSWIHDLRGLNSYIKLAGASGSSGSRNKSTVEHLIKKLDDTDPDVRVDAVKALGWKKDKRAVESLIKKLKGNDDKVRLATINALGEIGDEKAVSPLTMIFDDDDTDDDTFIAAAKSLAMIYKKKHQLL